ncbi:hypothetical protein ABPG74_019911 [Tetrahymena malaccensis]
MSLLSNVINELQNTEMYFIKACIKAYKPHFHIQYATQAQKMDIHYQDSEDYIFQKFREKNIMKQVKIFDEKLKIKKLLVIFKSCFLTEKELEAIQDIFKCFLRQDLILNLYDQYFLDPDSRFYVFETECFDLTSNILSQNYKISNAQIQKIIKKQKDYIFQLLDIQKNDNEDDCSEDSQYLKEVYINQINQNQIQIKFNLFDFFEQIKSLAQDISSQPVLHSAQSVEWYQKQKKTEIEENIYFISSEQLQFYEENAFLQVSKQNFMDKLSQVNKRIFQYHSIDIFEIVSQHPQYENFEFIFSSSSHFKFRIQKAKTNIVLYGIKFKTLKEAQDEENQYKILINLQGKLKSNIIDTQVFQLVDFTYLLLEEKTYSDEQLCSIYKQVFQKNRLSSQSYLENYQLVNMLKGLVNLSFELYSVHNMKITNIDPQKIQIQLRNALTDADNFLIKGLCFKNCFQEYIKMITQVYYNLNECYEYTKAFTYDGFNPQINHYYSIVKYFNMIQQFSQDSLEQVKILYQNIKNEIDLLLYVEQQRQINSLELFDLKISKHNPLKLSIDLSNSNYDGLDEQKKQQPFQKIQFLKRNEELIQKISLKTNLSLNQYTKKQNVDLHLNNIFSRHLFSIPQLQVQDQQDIKLEDVMKNLEEIGWSNTKHYKNYNIGLSVCTNLRNLQILQLEFSEQFDLSIILKDNEFLRLSNQILMLELIFKRDDENIINLIQKVKEYKNINTLSIKTLSPQNKIKQIIQKILNLVIINQKFFSLFFTYNSYKVDNHSGFFF